MGEKKMIPAGRIAVEILGVTVYVRDVQGAPPEPAAPAALLVENRRPFLSLPDLLAEVCATSGVNPEAIIRQDAHLTMVRIRRRFAKAARAHGYSFPEIGRVLHRHHSTVMHLVKAERPEE